MTTTQIDEAVLAAAGAHWMKVAMVIAKTAGTQGISLPEGEDGLLIAERLEALVHEGRLVAQGDLRNWRHSEVRRP